MDCFKIVAPKGTKDFGEYYDLRWRILREPWGQPRGSEKDNFENRAIHVCVKSNAGDIIGVGRLNKAKPAVAQIRYMAVDEQYRKQGIGRMICQYLENEARKQGYTSIILDSRINAVGFYQKLGYEITGDGHTLFDSIEHKVMEKIIS
jgi:ribosomal protein S18 acetylase RimI-like enzyme